jgi:tetratricopeptide (TPR) repeat protein/S1-C subfamily serine protease
MTSVYLRGLIPLGLLLGAAFAGGPRLRPPPELRSGADVYRRVLSATAWVQAAGSGKGSGWVVDRRRRWLVTCCHVIGENDTVEVVFPVRRKGAVIAERQYYITHFPDLQKRGYAVRGRVLRRVHQTDLALVELETLPAGVGELRLADSSAGPGERVHLVGNRYDMDSLWAYGSGAVRQVRTLRDGYFTAGRQLAKGARVLMAQVPINEGDSGGPLVNGQGEVVGVAAAVAWDQQGAGLFIDVRAVRTLVGIAPPEEETGGHAAYRRGMRSLALVQYPGGARAAGVLLDRRRRLLLTTLEAVGREETVEVIFPVWQGGRVIAEAGFYRRERDLLRKKGMLGTGVVLATDARRNLALVEAARVPAASAEAALSAKQPVPGDTLHVLSNPARLDVLWVYAAASVRQADHANLGQTGEGPNPAVLVVQASLVEGEGGGPLLDERGRLVGLVSGKVGPQQQVAYALPLAELKAFIETVRPRAAPASAAEFVRRGLLFIQAHQYERAIQDFSAALRRDPRHAPAWSERGRAHGLLGALDRALADCDRAVRLDPRLASAYAHRAAVRCDRGEAGRALKDCAEALRLAPRLAIAYVARARARLLQGDAERALADAGEAIWLDRNLSGAYLVRGRAQARKGAHDRAIADFTQTLALDRRLAEALRRRGDAHWARSDVAAALADYWQALALRPRDARALYGRGRALAARGEPGALTDLESALRLDPKLAGAYLERGGVQVRRGKVGKGVADWARAVQLEPKLADPVLGEAERRAADLLEADNAAGCAELCRRTLAALQPLFKDRPGVQKTITAGLARTARETDEKKRARALRGLLAAVRGQL